MYITAPTICFSDENEKAFPEIMKNVSEEYGEFFETMACPEEDQTDEMIVCCGEKANNEQRCCTNEEK